MSANFYRINTLTLANFKFSTLLHWMQSWGELQIVQYSIIQYDSVYVYCTYVDSIVCTIFICTIVGNSFKSLYNSAAKSLQSCLTLCDPTDSSPPGSPVPGILQARMLEWVAISLSNAWKWKVKVTSLSSVWLFTTPWTAAYQALPSMGFSRQEYWRGVPLPSLQNIVKQLGSDEFRVLTGFPGGSDTKEPACSAGNLGSIPGSGRSPGEGMAAPSSILTWRIPWAEKPGGVHGITKSRAWLSGYHLTLNIISL